MRYKLASLATLLGLLTAALPAHASAPCFDYVYVEGNEGGSSGGHAAIRFGDVTYHFQHESPGVLRLHRDEWRGFVYQYAGLENRPIHVSRVATSEETCAQLRDRFAAAHVIQNKHFDLFESARADRELLSQLIAHRHGERSTIRVPGAGFFFADEAQIQPVDTPAPPLVTLRTRILRSDGADFLLRRRREVEDQLVQLAPDGRPAQPLAEEVYPTGEYAFSSHYRDLLSGLFAVRALEEALPLRPDSYHAPDQEAFRLSAAEIQTLQASAEQLTDELVRLVHSSRPDWGFPLLIGLARLVALDESIRLGRLGFLDAFPTDAKSIDHPSVASHRNILPDLLDEARDEMRHARAKAFAGRNIHEVALSALEAAANRLHALTVAIDDGQDLRVSPGQLLPSRSAARADFIAPDASEAELTDGFIQAQEREAAYAAELRRLYGYNLITKNCVSELFRLTNAAVGAGVATNDIEPESRRRLGGYINTRWSLDFIPFVSAHAVDETYHVVERTEIPSYRHAKLVEMAHTEGTLAVAARESNTLTSTLYRRRSEDSFFIFFTDDAVLLRPLFGALNLVAGLGASAAGIALAPLDGGHAVSAGLRGALFSLPELAFVNIRKGSYDYIRRADRPGASS